MEKLLKLLNQYEKERIKNLNKNQTYGFKLRYTPYIEGSLKLWAIYTQVISKPFGFIKWLVENDKIEINNLSLKAFKNIFSGGGFVEVSDLEVLLMLLSISDTPIDDLISYLK